MRIKLRRSAGLLLTGILIGLAAGCSNKEDGMKQFVPPTPAQTQQYREAQVKSVQDNPNIPPDQKARIIGMYNGASRPPSASTAAAAHNQ